MKNTKIIASAVLSILLSTSSVCMANLTLNDLVLPKTPAYRVGISDIPENQYIETKQEKITKENNTKISKDENNIDVSYSELSIKRLSREISQELSYEESDMVADLSLLWQGAAMQSDTINFALYKLANPDADKPNKQTVKKVLKTIASMSTLAGASMGNPLLAGTSFIGGDVLGIMSQDTKALNYKYTKVTDADMIILIRKVEDLQQNAVNLYYDYMSARKQFDMTTNLINERKKRFESAQKNNAPRELIVITDAYYRTALDKHRNARSEFLSKRAALEQFVGSETFKQFEQELEERVKNEKTQLSAEEKQQYSDTIKSVENYTNNLPDSSEETKTSYYDANMDKLPDIAPLNSTEDKKETVEHISDENPAAVVSNKKVKKTKEQKKQDKYSTKGLIFLHPERENTVQNAQTEEPKTEKKEKSSKQKNKQSKTSQVQNSEPPKTQKVNGFEFLPLEEIKAPDLHKGGYSIFAE